MRKLIDEARRSSTDADRTRDAHARAFRFMNAIAGDLPRFEEAVRALFANDRSALEARVAKWPPDVAVHLIQLAFGVASSIQTKAHSP